MTNEVEETSTGAGEQTNNDEKPSLQKRFDVTDEDLDQLFEVLQKLPTNNVWSKVTKKDIVAKRFALGFVNNILCCEMTEEARKRLCTKSTDCPAIVAKFINDKMFFEFDKTEQAMICAIVAANKLGPRLLLVTPNCHITEYIDNSSTYSYDDDFNKSTVKLLAKTLARYHSLEMPVSRMMSDQWNDFRDKELDDSPWGEVFTTKSYLKILDKFPELKQKPFYSLLMEFDARVPSAEVRHYAHECVSPLVFVHNDFNRGNILVRNKFPKNDDEEEEEEVEKEIFLLDFDYSTLGKRGLDFGRFFSNFKHHDPMFGNEGFPDDRDMIPFLTTYRMEMARLMAGPDAEQYLRDDLNSVAHMIGEAKVFTLNVYLLDAMFALSMIDSDPNANRETVERFLNIFESRYSGYCQLRQRFLDDQTIQPFVARSPPSTADS